MMGSSGVELWCPLVLNNGVVSLGGSFRYVVPPCVHALAIGPGGGGAKAGAGRGVLSPPDQQNVAETLSED